MLNPIAGLLEARHGLRHAVLKNLNGRGLGERAGAEDDGG